MDTPADSRAVLDQFHPAVAAWFRSQFDDLTEPQARGWPSIRKRRHTLIAAPTGSGKTLAAFLAAIDDLVVDGLAGTLADETKVVYVSPLKALSNDIHRNLEHPLVGIHRQLIEMGLPPVEVRAMVRTGDTPSSERTRMIRNPPHILVTTPESLYILLTSDGGRRMLGTARTVIVDEIHAIANDKRGSHLGLSLERLDHLAGEPLVRIGLSATQRPIERVARFLVGTGRPLPGLDELPVDDRSAAPRTGAVQGEAPESEVDGAITPPGCEIVDSGHRRKMDLAIELPGSPLEAIMSNEVWEEVYRRLGELIEEHRTTLIFVNTRRLAERTAHHLSDLIGEHNVAAHHGSLSREQRLESEQRLKSGSLRAMVATASLELGIDIGEIDLVCQLGSTRAIATMLQRVGRSGHTLSGTPKGRLFPLSRDELVECAALLDAAASGDLDTLIIPRSPIDILAQQMVAEVAPGEWQEDDLYALMRRADTFRDLERRQFDDVVRMLADGFSTRRGRRGAHLHHDQVNGRLRPRRGARLAAITSGGAIPEVADFRVVLEPSGTFVGTLDQDFAIESLPGDIFQLGNQSYRILRIEQKGVLRVEDARGQPPTLPFWFGEAPGRTAELSAAVSRLRARIAARLEEEPDGESPAALAATARWLTENVPVSRPVADQLVEYLAAGRAALGSMPSQENLVIERFFDDAGDMHVVIHSPFGSRLNRAWGLALRKRFCRSFNFELQAAATEDAIVLSLGPTHSFQLGDVFRFLHSSSVREVLVQAFLDAPMFPTRWRWNANRSLAVLRWRGGKRVPPHLQQMDAEDLMAVVFPDQLACLENIAGDREIPDHPLVHQTIRDCLEEAMDIDELEALLRRIEAGELTVSARDLREPSPLAHEAISARPYAFLDPAPAEERRTLAISTSRWMDPRTAADLGRLDAAAIGRVREEAWPQARDADELHDALVLLGLATEQEGIAGDADGSQSWSGFLDELVGQRRATRLQPPAGTAPTTDATAGTATTIDAPTVFWVAAERLPELEALYPGAVCDPVLEVPERLRERRWESDEALVEVLRGRVEACGPITAAAAAADLALPVERVERAFLALEAEGFVLRGRFTAAATAAAGVVEGDACEDAPTEWCERRLLARIHRYTISRLRSEIEPVSARDFMAFLLGWQRVACDEPVTGGESLSPIVEQLEGFPAQSAAWESDIIPARLADYDPVWLDALCLAGRLTWGRMSPPAAKAPANGGPTRRSGPIRATPTTLMSREMLPTWQAFSVAPEPGALELTGPALAAYDHLRDRGASFFHELATATGLLETQLENALGELVAWGLLTADSFTGLRALLVPSSKRPLRRNGRRKESVAVFGVENAGRWSLLWPSAAPLAETSAAAVPPAAAAGGGPASSGAGPAGLAPAALGEANAYWERVEDVGRVLLRRYGVMFRRLLDREGRLPPWRDLLRAYRRLEARGEIRGGRFVAGFSGEQFALPEAIPGLRKARQSAAGGMVSVSAADPLNLVGVITPGERIPALARNRVLYDDGVPVAALIGGEVRFLEDLDVGRQWEAKNRLVRRVVPPRLRAYLGRSA